MIESGQLRFFTGSGSDIYIFDWNLVDYSPAENYSTIYWTLTGSGGVDYDTVAVVFNNTVPYTSPADASGSDGVVVTGTTRIPHLANGNNITTVKVIETYRSWLSGTSTRADALPLYLSPIPKDVIITSAPDFSSYSDAVVNYENVGGTFTEEMKICISLDGTNPLIGWRNMDNTITKGTYTFELSLNDRKLLKEAVTSGITIPITFIISYRRNDKVYKKASQQAIFSLEEDGIKFNPIIKAIDARTLAVTGDSSGGTLIENYSTVSYNIGAYSINNGVIQSQNLINGSYELIDSTTGIGTIEKVDSNTFYLSATDNRGNTARRAVVFQEYNKKYIPYVKLTCSLETGLLTSNGDLPFTIRGKLFDESFGAVTNHLYMDYAIVDTEGNWYVEKVDASGNKTMVISTDGESSGRNLLERINPDVDSNYNYTFEYTIKGLNHSKQYELNVAIWDELTPRQETATVVKAIPNFDWGATDFHHHTDVHFSNDIYIKDEKLADFIIEQDSASGWFYRKWNSGVVELFRAYNITGLECNTNLGGWFRTPVQSSPSFPFSVINPQVVANYESAGYGALIWATTKTNTAKPFDFYLIRPTSGTITGTVMYHVIGAWKGV